MTLTGTPPADLVAASVKKAGRASLISDRERVEFMAGIEPTTGPLSVAGLDELLASVKAEIAEGWLPAEAAASEIDRRRGEAAA